LSAPASPQRGQRTGRMMDETLGKVHFWLTFIGFHGTRT
jgi:heme/copper-type cytochrome/quinol oxidase subunit 1